MVQQVASAAEPTTRIISGYDENRAIFIVDDGINNIIILQSDTGTSKHFDSKVKTYNSGGFIMINPESGIFVVAHLMDDSKYKLTVLTSDTVYRFIGVPRYIEELYENPVSSETNNDEGIIESETSGTEPNSSVGSDITRYDVPNISLRDSGTEFLLGMKADQIKSLRLGDKYEFLGTVYSVRDSAKIEDADVTLEISRDDYVLKSVKTQTGVGGKVHIELEDMTYPLFYPKFCYDVKVIAEYNGYTFVWTDDFVMDNELGERVWEPDMSWLNIDRWNYLPNEFRNEPRTSTYADSRCN